MKWVVERRLVEGKAPYPVEIDLIRAAPERVLRGLAACAQLADGGTLGPAVTAPAEVLRVLEEVVPPSFLLKATRRRIEGRPVLAVGLLRTTCGLTFREIAERTGMTQTRMRRHLELHRRALLGDPLYRGLAVQVASRAVRASLLGVCARNWSGTGMIA